MGILRMRRALLVIAVTFVLVIVTAIGWILFGGSIREHVRRQRFEPAAWRGGESSTNALRIRMVDDLLRQYSFHGMTREQVTAVIGEPDKTPYFKEWDLVYWLGPERNWISIDSEWLVFRFDSRKRIADYKIVTD